MKNMQFLLGLAISKVFKDQMNVIVQLRTNMANIFRFFLTFFNIQRKLEKREKYAIFFE